MYEDVFTQVVGSFNNNPLRVLVLFLLAFDIAVQLVSICAIIDEHIGELVQAVDARSGVLHEAVLKLATPEQIASAGPLTP